jgi:hypothetical protein
MVMKDKRSRFPLNVFFLFLSLLALLAVAIGLYGVLSLVGLVREPLTAAQRQQATATGQAQADRATSTAEIRAAISATERARWTRIVYNTFDAPDRTTWPLGDQSNSDAKVETKIDGGYFSIDAAALADVNQIVWSDLVVDSDFLLEIEIEGPSRGSGAAYGIAFGKNQYNFYTFLFDETPKFWVNIIRHGEAYTLIAPYQTNAILPGETNRLRVVSEDERIQFFINDHLVGSVENQRRESVRFGLCFKLRQDQEARILFDNFSLSTPAK